MSTSSADSSRFLTNRKLSNQEKIYIQNLLLHAMDEFARLTRRQAELASDISHYKVAIAPHKVLPEHILQLIFQWCIPQDGLCVPHDRALAFTQVCSSWRKLAMDTPELWRDVTVELKKDHYNGRRIDLAHEWLSRAGNTPKSLKIQGLHSGWDSEAADHRLVMPFRFRSLDLALSLDQLRRLLSNPPLTQSLESLQLAVVGTSMLFPSVVYEDCKNSAYNLITTLPWGQLRHLSINNATTPASTLINVLSNCLVLEQLSMTLCRDPAPCDAPASFITLPNLEQLALHFETASNPEVFFRSLVLPRIKTLEMTMTNFHTEMPGCTSQHFASMAQRSGMSRIQELRLGKGAELYRLVDLLKHTPSLSYLDVSGGVVFHSQTLEDMSTGQLGSNMRTLYLHEVEDSLRILDMVWTRSQNASRDEVSATPITDIRIPVADGDVAEVEEWVDKLGDLGINCFYDDDQQYLFTIVSELLPVES